MYGNPLITKKTFNALKYLSFILSMLFALPSWGDNINLPELGDSSATALSAEQENNLGRETLWRLKHSGLIIDDPIVTGYIEQLGHSLAASADDATQKFTFFIVDAESINAFALPGGYIGVHSGLILASNSESELAAVVAHEIAHVTQHHIARSYEYANKMQLPLTAAVLAAILLGNGDPNVINAALASSLGGTQQLQLDFTRANEYEADRIGMQMLATSDFDPNGMANFFGRLQDQTRYYGNGVPEFLRTHPVTSTRLAEAEDRARLYPQKMVSDSGTYQIIKAILRLHHEKSPEKLLNQLESKGTSESHRTLADRYLLALLQLKQGYADKAQKILSGLLHAHPEIIALRKSLGELEMQQQHYAQAMAIYREGLKLYPDNTILILSLAETFIAQQKNDDARTQLQELLRNHPKTATAYQLLAKLESQSGNDAAAHLAQAEYYLLIEEPRSALEQLQLAKRIKNLDFYHANRIEAMNQQVKEMIDAEKQR